jgi:hypothetical protein
MSRNTDVSVTRGNWVQLTDADVTSITFQNKGPDHVFVAVTAGATAPTSTAAAYRYNPGQGERNVALADLAPGISGARVYAYLPPEASKAAVDVSVSHA